MAMVRVSVPVSDEQLLRITEENPGWKIERVGGGLLMNATNASGGLQNARLTVLLSLWGEPHGYEVFDSNTGFTMPNGDVLSPDCSAIRGERWQALDRETQRSYAPLVPDVIVELMSPTDRLKAAREKCERWHRDGSAFVVLLDPDRHLFQTWGTPPSGFPDGDAIFAYILR